MVGVGFVKKKKGGVFIILSGMFSVDVSSADGTSEHWTTKRSKLFMRI